MCPITSKELVRHMVNDFLIARAYSSRPVHPVVHALDTIFDNFRRTIVNRRKDMEGGLWAANELQRGKGHGIA